MSVVQLVLAGFASGSLHAWSASAPTSVLLPPMTEVTGPQSRRQHGGDGGNHRGLLGREQAQQEAQLGTAIRLKNAWRTRFDHVASGGRA